MVAFDSKYVNSDEKGGKKPEVKKKVEEDEDDDESSKYSHFTSHQGQRGFGRGRGGNVVYCSSQ